MNRSAWISGKLTIIGESPLSALATRAITAIESADSIRTKFGMRYVWEACSAQLAKVHFDVCDALREALSWTDIDASVYAEFISDLRLLADETKRWHDAATSWPDSTSSAPAFDPWSSAA